MYNLSSRRPGQKLSTSDKGALFELIVSSVLNGTHTSEIIAEIRAKFGLSDRQTMRYLKTAREYIYNRPEETVERKRNLASQRYEELYRTAEHTRDRIDALRQWCRINGLDETTVRMIHSKLDGIGTERLIEIVQDNDTDTSDSIKSTG